MKLNYSQTFKTLEGEDYLDNAQPPKILTLEQAIIMSCSAHTQGDENMPALDKYKVGEIAVTVHKGLDLTSEQVVKVKDRIAKVFTPILVYLIHEALENPVAEPLKAKK